MSQRKSTNVTIWGDRPPARCVWCLRPAWSDTSTCRECRSIEINLNNPVDHTHALRGGRWVKRGAILVWDGPRPQDDEQVRPVAACGTDSGYRKHYRAGEPTCEPCRAAHSTASRKWSAA